MHHCAAGEIILWNDSETANTHSAFGIPAQLAIDSCHGVLAGRKKWQEMQF